MQAYREQPEQLVQLVLMVQLELQAPRGLLELALQVQQGPLERPEQLVLKELQVQLEQQVQRVQEQQVQLELLERLVELVQLELLVP